ncbi:hypothetical protein [Methanofollis fontis]|uniref:Uncharacterized protein n=1 Tax=Methanofollis fontis TaxID=2052832 RepID=A0A483CZH9_9EURY|nr:hypothetical protein [Methanofollis fontis]TAJ45509.1 hypothetical protein CUJ86_01925 [Methanofollis fontis]
MIPLVEVDPRRERGRTGKLKRGRKEVPEGMSEREVKRDPLPLCFHWSIWRRRGGEEEGEMAVDQGGKDGGGWEGRNLNFFVFAVFL